MVDEDCTGEMESVVHNSEIWRVEWLGWKDGRG